MIHKEKVIDLCFSNVFPCTYETNKQRNDSKKRTKKVRSIQAFVKYQATLMVRKFGKKGYRIHLEYQHGC